MPTVTDRILALLPGTFQKKPRPPALYAVVDTFGSQLQLAENNLSAVMLSHWVDTADKGAKRIEDLKSIASLYGLEPRHDETVEEFRRHLKHYVRTFLDGTVTVQGILRVTAENLGIDIADLYEQLDTWWTRPENELISVRLDESDVAEQLLGTTKIFASGNSARAAITRGTVEISGVVLRNPSFLYLGVDASRTKEISLPPGPVDPAALAMVINTELNQPVARIEKDRLILSSTAVGTGSSVRIEDGPQDAARALLGLLPHVYRGGVPRAARMVGAPDLSKGVDLRYRRYLRIAIDEKYFAEVDCANPQTPKSTNLDFICLAINQSLGVEVANHNGRRIILLSPTRGGRSSIVIQPATAQDAAPILLGKVSREVGSDAQPARALASRDLTEGVDLSRGSHVRLRIDDSTETVDCKGQDPANTQTQEIVDAINHQFGFAVAAPEGTGISVSSRVVGPKGLVAFEALPSGDAVEAIFGIGTRRFQGADAAGAKIVGLSDLHAGADLSARHLLQIAIDGGPPRTIDLRSKTRHSRRYSLPQIVQEINRVAKIASGDGTHLTLASSTKGPESKLEVVPLVQAEVRRFVTRATIIDEAAQSLLGFVRGRATGEPATSAVLRGSADLAYGVDLSRRSHLRITVDNNSPLEVNCAGLRMHATELADIVYAINRAMANAGIPKIAMSDGHHLVLTSPTSGAASRIEITAPLTTDPADALAALGLRAAKYSRQEATQIVFTSPVGLAKGVELDPNASVQLLIDDVEAEVNLGGRRGGRRLLAHLVEAINRTFGVEVASSNGTSLVLKSASFGLKSKIGFEIPRELDATRVVFGLTPPRVYRGRPMRPAQAMTAGRDLSQGVDLRASRMLRISVDGSPAKEIDCSSHAPRPGAATLAEIVLSINQALERDIASHDGKHLILTSPSKLPTASIELQRITLGDASEILLGELDPSAKGADPAPATITGKLTLTAPVDFSQRSLLRVAVNNEDPVDIDVAGRFPSATSLEEAVANINRIIPDLASITSNDKVRLTAPSTDAAESSLDVLPLRYLELIEYPPTAVEKGPFKVGPGESWSVVNDGAASSQADIYLETPKGVSSPEIVNLTAGRYVRVVAAVISGEKMHVARNKNGAVHVEIISRAGRARPVPVSNVLLGTLSRSLFVPFNGESRLSRDVGRTSTLQLDNPQASRTVTLRAHDSIRDPIAVSVVESDISSVGAPPPAGVAVKVDRIGRVSRTGREFWLLDHTELLIAQLRDGESIDLQVYDNQVVWLTGTSYPGKPPLVIVHEVARLFDATVRLLAKKDPPNPEVYRHVTIGDGPEARSLASVINVGSKFGQFSRLVRAEEFDKADILTVPKGKSEWIYLECNGARYDEANFNRSRFPVGRCGQYGAFDISRFSLRSPGRFESPAPLYAPLKPPPAPTASIMMRWMTYQPGSFVVNLPADLSARFGGTFGQAYFGSKDPEQYLGAVAEPQNDPKSLIHLIDTKPSKLVKARLVSRVPLGWEPVPLPTREPTPLTNGAGAEPARLYLTEQGLDGAIELTAERRGVWGNNITVSSRRSGPATYDVAIAFQGARFENARQFVRAAFPAFGPALTLANPVGVLQAKAAGVLAEVTRDGVRAAT